MEMGGQLNTAIREASRILEKLMNHSTGISDSYDRATEHESMLITFMRYRR